MSAPWRVTNLLCKTIVQTQLSSQRVPVVQICSSSISICTRSPTNPQSERLLQPYSGHVYMQVAGAQGFLNKLTAENLWKSVTSVSNPGKKKGRGRAVGRKASIDLNRGQKLGDGRVQIQWPGLNAPVMRNRMVLKQTEMKTATNRQQELIELREKLNMVRYPATPPLLRGYTGSLMVGMTLGPPDPVGDHTFEGFETALLEVRTVNNMTGTLGRKKHATALVVVGNGNGIVGWGYGKGSKPNMAIKQAKNRAAQGLCYIPMCEDHTVYHDMFSQYHESKIFIHRKENGYGLKCHRVIRSICKVIGLKDLHCKVEGSTKNYKAITKGFIEALVAQETPQELADRTGYHVVEQRRETDMVPKVIASPVDGVVHDDVCQEDRQNITFELNRMYLDGNIEYKRPVKNPFEKKRTYINATAVKHKRRGQKDLQVLRRAGLT